jgi:drug/metabolite transporter (DMT)-like permease
MGIFWGMIAALGWGTADFLVRGASVRLGAYRALLYAHLLSFGALLLLVWRIPPPGPATIPALALGLVLGAGNTAASLLLYRALAIGRLSIVSPIGSSFAAITLALSLLAGDLLSPLRLSGLLLTIVGVALASTPSDAPGDSHHGQRGVFEALLAALGFGITFWGLQFVVPTLGPALPVLLSRITSIVLLPLLARPLRQSIALPPRPTWALVIPISLLDTIANTAYNLGLRSDAPGVVAVLGSLFSPITVLLAFVLLREQLSWRQWCGVGLIFVAVATIGVADAPVVAGS